MGLGNFVQPRRFCQKILTTSRFCDSFFAINLLQIKKLTGAMQMLKVLIIDDSPEVIEATAVHFGGEGFDVTVADTGVKAIVRLNEKQFDCIIMDIMLPDIDGFTLCKAARSITAAPIIFLSSMDAPEDKVKGLMLGGDDYMTKPFDLGELTARVHAHLKREHRKRSLGSVSIDRQNRMIQTPRENVILAQKEFELFMLLFENPGKMFPKKELLKRVWNEDTDIGTVAVHILKLRRKLTFAAPFVGAIENDYKHGYYITKPE
jgi:DNA-binding response OmpR family regulator